MNQDIEQLFFEEIRENTSSDSGFRHIPYDSGTLGRGAFPVESPGQEYSQSGSSDSPMLNEILGKTKNAPLLKSVLLTRLDEEYQHYRHSIEKTLDGVQMLMQETLGTVEQQLNYFHHRLQQLEIRLGSDPLPPLPSWTASRRIRWGATPEEIRNTVIQQARRLEAMGKELKVDTIKTEVPGMLRWLYGERAVFKGIKGLARTLRESSSPSDTGVK